MAVKPPIIPWDSTLANIVAVTGTHQTNGVALGGEIPISGEENSWKNNTYLWFLYLLNNIATVTHNTFPKVLALGSWLFNSGGGGQPACFQVTATSTLHGDLDVPVGYKLSTLTFGLQAVLAASGTLVINIMQNLAAINPPVFHTRTFASGSLPTSLTDQTFNFLATTNLVASVTVAAAGGTYTRTTGSFLTDGFWVGQQIQWSGFTNGGNNVVKTITALTATVMTVSNTGLVNETGASVATCNGVSPTVDATFGWGIQYAFTAGSGAIDVGILRYTCVPQ